ncbi:MAG: hypothetical protein AAB534_01325 [Patescibacteria group bacterium]
MIKWINFLHIYQPPTQDSAILKKVSEESYSHILKLADKYPDLKLTLNISGSLLEKFQENHMGELIEGYKKLLESRRIELTGSAMYHPILPLIPESEVIDQIALNNKKCEEVFGDLYKPTGFYLPEMAYSKKVAKIIKDAGFKWIILDEIHFPNGQVSDKTKYILKDIGLEVLFRDRKFSKSFPPESVVENLEKINEKYLITAHDGELYGHWHKEEKGYYDKAFKNQDIKNLLVSEYLNELKETQEVEPVEANWESLGEEIKNGNPYALWNTSKNKIQKELWSLEELVYSIISKNESDPNFKEAKSHYDKGVSSCYFWWASERKIDVFSPISWNPTEIEKGLNELLRSIRSLNKLDGKIKIKAEKDFNNLRTLIWQKHWERESKK